MWHCLLQSALPCCCACYAPGHLQLATAATTCIARLRRIRTSSIQSSALQPWATQRAGNEVACSSTQPCERLRRMEMGTCDSVDVGDCCCRRLHPKFIWQGETENGHGERRHTVVPCVLQHGDGVARRQPVVHRLWQPESGEGRPEPLCPQASWMLTADTGLRIHCSLRQQQHQ